MWAFKYEVMFAILSGVVFFYFLEYTIGKNAGDELENENKEDKIIEAIRKFAIKRKILFALLVIVIFGILIPLIIDLAYFIGRYLPSIKAPWGASDVFMFYGTLLSATATIIAVTCTIKATRESAKIDRNNQMILNNRNLIITYATDFIDAINYQKVSTEILKIMPKKNWKFNIQEIEIFRKELLLIIANSNTAFAKYKLFQNENNAQIFTELSEYIGEYHDDIIKFDNHFNELSKMMIMIKEMPSDRKPVKKLAYESESTKIYKVLNEYTDKYKPRHESMLKAVKKTIPEIIIENYEKEANTSHDNKIQQ
ncbi:MAG: hypothetical protein CVU98_06900 [Firmicutes bacterium HGW-Firmicutes-3]|nr:MAG: hypothetical protein CVV00_11580 [Firmicutes bacterium HGW-Firmicutes-5]PKM57275.1 MAG: hypothetical protein CVU98_06900 [Firmicutes bacterium HGW-Firmicutes-3]